MATRFIPTVERELIDLVYVFPNSCIRTDEQIESLTSDRNVAGQCHPSPLALILNSRYSLE